mmetsp:Transcript_11460/g.35027  ORF Transcript_11460/g.35027 Transcript_11460/m.35027 type:complete len:118 (+) Transcript_11460:297-650(+)
MAESGSGGVDSSSERKQNRIQVSRERRPLGFFINLAKKFLQTEDEVELSGLGLAVASAVTIAEVLKQSGLIEITSIETSLVEAYDERKSKSPPKAKIQIRIKKTEEFFKLCRRPQPG